MLNRVDLSRTDLNLLALFEAVLEEGHVGRAATRMNLTPSAVSHGLGRLRRLLNDPLFLRTPRGVVPTARARELAAPIAEVLAEVRGILASAEPFDPATSTRRFVIGAPDAVVAVIAAPLLGALRGAAPGIGVSLRQLLPAPGETLPARAWLSALADLEARRIDLAVVPSDVLPARFRATPLYEEDFVVAMRPDHPLAGGLTLDGYCAAAHAVVSASGDPAGFVDRALGQQGRARRVALTVPDFFFALSVAAGSDLVTAVPRRFAEGFAGGFGLVWREAPLPLDRFRITLVAPEAAMADAGLAWVAGLMAPG